MARASLLGMREALTAFISLRYSRRLAPEGAGLTMSVAFAAHYYFHETGTLGVNSACHICHVLIPESASGISIIPAARYARISAPAAGLRCGGPIFAPPASATRVRKRSRRIRL